MSHERHRVRLPRQRVKRRFRIGQWRRVIIGLSVLLGTGLLVGGAVWGGVYVVSNFHLGERRQTAAVEAPPGESLAEPRLIGVWQSDADANIEETRRTQTISEKEERDLRARIFSTKVTYTDKMIATETDGDTQRETYQVVAKNGDEVVIKTWFNSRHQEEEMTIRFVGHNIYWADAPQFGLHECFRRIREKPE